MKGFIKGISMTAAVLFAIGIGTIVFGAVTGGDMVNVPLGNSGYYIFNNMSLDWFDWGEDDGYVAPDNITINPPTVAAPQHVPQNQAIDSLDFEIGAANFEIVYGDEFKLETEGKNKYTSEVDGSTWKIKMYDNNLVKGRIETVVVTIPQATVFNHVELSFAAGSFKVDGIVTDELDLEVGAGNLNGSDFVVNKKTSISSGASNIELNGMFNGKNDYECGAGRLVVNFDEKPTDYGYSVELGLGHANIFDKSFNGIADSQKNKDATTYFDVECGVGSIEIN